MRWVVFAGLVFAVFASACEGGDPERGGTSPTTTSPPTMTSSPPTPTPIATPPNGVEMVAGDNAPFPDDMGFLVETGCWGCEGPMKELVRVYRDTSGRLRSESLLDPEHLQYGAREVADGTTAMPYINGFAAEPNGSVMAASVCIKLSCAPRGLDEWYADSISVILRSEDGGVTWKEIARGGPALSVIGIVGDQVLAANFLSPEGPAQFSLLPGGTALKPPVGAGGNWPLAVSGQVLWRTDSGQLLLNDGRKFVRLPVFLDDQAYVPKMVGGFSGLETGSAFVQWFEQFQTLARTYFAPLDIASAEVHTGKILYTDRISYLGWFDPKNNRALVSIDAMGAVPAFLDLDSGRYRVVAEPFATADFQPVSGRHILHAVQIGPFARVVNTGSCLRVRAEPSLSSQTLDCLADGVLLQASGEARDADSITWLRVMTPGGVQGWASTVFLER